MPHPKGEINALHAPSADRQDAKDLVTRYSNCRNISTSSQTSRIARSSEKTDSLVGCVEHAPYAVRYAIRIWCNRKV